MALPPRSYRPIKLWLDDVRPAPQGWVHVRSVDEAKTIFATEVVDEASLDHDLGACQTCQANHRAIADDDAPLCPHVATGFDLCAWLVATGNWPVCPPQVHSCNVVGAAQMRGLIARYWQPPAARRESFDDQEVVRSDGARRPDRAVDHAVWGEFVNSESPLVLVVEDDYDTRGLLTTLLASNGYRVITAANGAEGLAQMRVSRPAVILLDLMMPALGGIDFRRHQLADPEAAAIPVVCISAVANAVDIARALDIADCHVKPFDHERLLETIERCSRATATLAPPTVPSLPPA